MTISLYEICVPDVVGWTARRGPPGQEVRRRQMEWASGATSTDRPSAELPRVDQHSGERHSPHDPTTSGGASLKGNSGGPALGRTASSGRAVWRALFDPGLEYIERTPVDPGSDCVRAISPPGDAASSPALACLILDRADEQRRAIEGRSGAASDMVHPNPAPRLHSTAPTTSDRAAEIARPSTDTCRHRLESL